VALARAIVRDIEAENPDQVTPACFVARDYHAPHWLGCRAAADCSLLNTTVRAWRYRRPCDQLDSLPSLCSSVVWSRCWCDIPIYNLISWW